MELSVIIPAYNAATVIGEQLSALAAERWDAPWEIIVADNGSSDGTRAVVEGYARRMPHLRLIDAAARRGPAFGRNEGARQARGRNIAFVDADDVIAPGWVAAIGEALREHEFVASRFDIAQLNEEWVVRSRPNSQGKGLQRISYPPYLHHAGGCGLGVRRARHEQVGGFDERIPYLEDTDYCFRLQIAGVPMHFAGDATVNIRYRDSLPRMFRQARIWARYNAFLARKYRGYGPPFQPRRAWVAYVRRWGRLLRRLPTLRRREDVASWLRNCGWLIGLLHGSVVYRIPPV